MDSRVTAAAAYLGPPAARKPKPPERAQEVIDARDEYVYRKLVELDEKIAVLQMTRFS